MDIRNFRQKTVIKKRFWTSVFVAVIALILLYQIKNYLSQDDQTGVWTGEMFSGKQILVQKVGDKVKFAGTLSIDNHFPLYTHTIMRGSEKLGLKSTSINLNNYLGDIEIVGTFEDTDKGLPIINVDVVKMQKPGLIIKGNSYLFIKDLLYFDFTEQPQLSANKSGKNITVYYDKAPVFDVERFLCSKILKDKDCNQIIESYLRSQKDFFTSYRGYTFYKQSDKTRALFDGNIFGFMFKNADDNTLLDMSNMVKVVNKDFVLTNKKDLIAQKCKDDDDGLKTVEFAKVGFNDPYFLALTVEGISWNKKKYSCTLTFDLRNEWETQDVNFSVE